MPCSFTYNLPSTTGGADHSTFRCEFPVGERDLLEFEGKKYCIAHLPIEASADFPPGNHRNLFTNSIQHALIRSTACGQANLTGVVFRLPFFAEKFDPSFIRPLPVPRLILTAAYFVQEVHFSRRWANELVLDKATFKEGLCFSNAIYDGLVTLRDIVINGETKIHDTQFLRGLCTERGEFVGAVTVTDSLLRGDLIFLRCKFASPVKLTNVRCESGADFEESAFDKKFKSENSYFSDQVIFRRIAVTEDFTCDNNRFMGGSDWEGARFEKNLLIRRDQLNQTQNFTGTSFQGNAIFSEVSSLSRLNLTNATIHGDLILERSNFASLLELSKTVVRGNISAHNVQFRCPLLVRNSKISGDVLFSSANFEYKLDFSGSEFNGNFSLSESRQNPEYRNTPSAIFDNVRFCASARFSNRHFTDVTSFRFAIFREAPDFHGCDLHQSTDFSGASFRDTSAAAESRYRTLRHLMAGLRSRKDEGLFFKLEQRSRRRNMRIRQEPITWFASIMYDWIAGYGESIFKPLLVTFLTIGVFFGIHWMIGAVHPEIIKEFGVTPGQMLSFTVEQVVRPFAIWAPRGEVPGREWLPSLLVAEPLWLRVSATLETLFGLGAFTLLLLALRRRFSMT